MKMNRGWYLFCDAGGNIKLKAEKLLNIYSCICKTQKYFFVYSTYSEKAL
jgi:hypothetical protein